MTDRELLEFAAKAAGVKFVSMDNWPHQDGCRFWRGGDFCDCGAAWNPLTDDGDALRLMVKLGLITHPRVHHEIAVLMFTAGMQKLEATRRAIVITAAAIGKEMP